MTECIIDQRLMEQQEDRKCRDQRKSQDFDTFKRAHNKIFMPNVKA